MASRPVICFIHPAGRPINTSWLEVLRRPIESAQYRAFAFGQRCKLLGVRPPMGSRADAYDNAMAESFIATLKVECRARDRFATHAEARLTVFRYIEDWLY